MKTHANINGLNASDFEVISQLGSGSFGVVKLVKKHSNQQKYAIKEVLLSKLNVKQKQSALNQIRLLASIDLPNVIAYKGAYFDRNRLTLCLVMQYADGGDLQNKIRQQQQQFGVGFNEAFIWKVSYELLCGLKTLHYHKIIHRDIKSANVFFVQNQAKLGDLNVSRVAEKDMCETKAGTPYYTSPEIWNGQSYGNKCDIWSVGCLIYELCCLITPFRAKSFPTLYKKITMGQYQPISKKYSPELRQLISQCLIVNDKIRPTASQLLEKEFFSKISQFNQQQFGHVQLISPIKYPKALNLLNNRLPKAKFEDSSKKTVFFASKKFIDEELQNQQNEIRHFKTQKCIRLKQNEDITIKIEALPQISRKISSSKKNIKLPPLEDIQEKKQHHKPLDFSIKSKKRINIGKSTISNKSQKKNILLEKQNKNKSKQKIK